MGTPLEFVKLCAALVAGVFIGELVQRVGQPIHDAASNETANATAMTGLQYTQSGLDNIHLVFALIGLFGYLAFTIFITET